MGRAAHRTRFIDNRIKRCVKTLKLETMVECTQSNSFDIFSLLLFSCHEIRN